MSTLSVSKICRVCLLETENMKSVFSKLGKYEIFDTDVSTISDVLAKTTNVPVKENDGYPYLICLYCQKLLYEAYKFKVQFDRSRNTLQQLLAENVKKEVTIQNNIELIIEDDCDEPNDYEFEQKDGEELCKQTCETVTLVRDSCGTRFTSKTQIEKRAANINVTVPEAKLFKKQGRKSKIKLKQEEIQETESENEEQLADKPLLHPCPICTKEFPALELREHAHTHKALKKYLSIPNKEKVSPNTKFYVKPSELKPRITLHNRKEKIHKCVYCGCECTAVQLRIHLLAHRSQAEYKCDQCERVFRKINHLNTHRVKHLKEYPYKCEQCGKGFVIKRNYNCHILTHDTNQELPHECRHCLKRFSNPEHLHRHMVIHTENVSYSVKYKVCKCHRCLKTFKDRYDLKSHSCVPVEAAVNTQFPCKICDKVFKNSSGLYNHNRNIHKQKGVKVLCSVCGHHVSNIYNHMLRHTGEKPFQCNQCGKRFTGKPQLKQHLLVHSGLKPFVCSVCAKAFNNIYNLQVHERIHKGDRCHICPICNKGFLEKSYLKKHMNVHTKL